MRERIKVNDLPSDFTRWINELKKAKLSFEIVVDNSFISHVYVMEPDNGDWNDLFFGRIIYSAGTSVRQNVYKPIIIDGKFKKDEGKK